MTRELLNTLYVGTHDARLFLKDESVVVKLEDEQLLRVPLHHLGSICVFGIVHPSVPLMLKCAEEGRSVVFFDMNGRFKARLQGKSTGNVLLRRDQWSGALCEVTSLSLAKSIVAGKLQNARQVLLRGARDYPEDAETLQDAALEHAAGLDSLEDAATLDEVRGMEGNAASAYFGAFPKLIRVPTQEFSFSIRSRRPPRDRMNALLSFAYSLGTSDCASALEGVGLDPQCGYLHALRPGRPALALDLLEEFRSVWLDRLCLNLVNRRELKAGDFVEGEGGSWRLTDDARKLVLAAYQNRKKLEVQHEILKGKVPIGLLPHLQARLLARFLRGELPVYTPWMVN
ncbi:MAG TPA: type I-C CRISPR-associated endonuclease Cas1c [Fimbriimonadaceae bacterium]|nr:type I-C CRISPR-associated endonuclease Cas1c [Fimbriimonadaceae bacterium]